VLDAAVALVLSQNTSNANSERGTSLLLSKLPALAEPRSTSVPDSTGSGSLRHVTTALASMNAAFPGGTAAVLAAPEERLEESIRCGGLSKMKASRIHALLRQVRWR
jgi:endonuclease III